METKTKSDDDIIKRLNILIALLLEQLSAETTLSMVDRIVKLAQLGVPPAEIARILAKPLNYVTASLSQRRSKKREAKANG